MKNLNKVILIALIFSVNLLFAQNSTFNYTGIVQTYIVPAGIGSIEIKAIGAEGGSGIRVSSGVGGKGASIQGDFIVVPGQVLKILVGEQGDGPEYVGGGGGGTFVWDNATGELLIAAGGGGGGGATDIVSGFTNGIDAIVTINGANGAGFSDGAGTLGNGAVIPTAINYASGGAGWASVGNDGTTHGCSNESTSGQIPLLGGAGGNGGGNVAADGGFGGGGGGNGRCGGVGGGGGGGYSGGGAGGEIVLGAYNGGGGGGSFNSGTNKVETAGTTIGNGQVLITSLCFILNVSLSDTTLCLGEELILNASSPFTNNLSWNMGVVNNVAFKPSSIGTITYTVTSDNSNDCPFSQDILVHDSISILGIVTFDNNTNTGAIDITVSSDGNNYLYDWNTDGTGDFNDLEDVSDLSVGNYIVVVKNNLSCMSSKTFIVYNTVGIDNVYSQDIKLYPNPTSSKLNIDFPYIFSYEVISVDGKTMLKGETVNSVSLDVESLPNNIYYLILNSKDQRVKGIFIKE
ncbi:MAG: hypothetical protein COA58_04055 [Bacteroidetes bacterium]|nr:MAG: hypothetical protein COA58_04055 [Bacteroidota bacterium]